MDERWKCPNCGFYNDRDEMYCISCGTPPPDESLVDEVSAEPADDPVFTSYLRDLEYRPRPLDLPLYAPRPDNEESAEPIPGSLPMPTLQPLTSPPPVKRPTRPKLDDIAKKIEHLRRLKSPTSGSPSRKVVPKLAIFIALAAIAGAIGANFADRDDTTSATSVASVPIVVDHEDDAYFDSLELVNEERNALVDVTNDRWDAWLELENDGFPPVEYLVMDELIAFQMQVQAMPPPVSDEVRRLHDAWTANLNSLVMAEQTLATDPDQDNLDAELDAWHTEDASYTALYEHMQARE